MDNIYLLFDIIFIYVFISLYFLTSRSRNGLGLHSITYNIHIDIILMVPI